MKKTLGEIIESVHEGQRPDYEDLRYAVVALCALRTFDYLALQKLHQAKVENQKPVLTRDPSYAFEESHNRYRRALLIPPKDYCGPSHDPDTEECQHWRRLSKKIIAKVSLLLLLLLTACAAPKPAPPRAGPVLELDERASFEHDMKALNEYDR